MTPAARRPVDWVAIGVAVLALLSQAFGGYLHNDKVLAQSINDVQSQVSALKAQRADDHEAIQRIDDTVQRIEQLLLKR